MPEYQYDYFLSYTWEDNERPSSGLSPGWVDRFEEALGRELRDLWWQQIRPFRDSNKIKVGDIADAIDAAIPQALSFVCLVSRTFLTSDWCVDELRKMSAAIETEPLLPSEKASQRILPVLLGHIPEDHLGALADLKCVKAYAGSEEDWTLLEPSDQGAGRRMAREVAMMVKEVVKNVRGKGGPLYGRNGQVFLSASPDLEFNRLGLRASFEDYGFPVVPGGILPTNRQAYTEQITHLVTESRASVHGFGNLLPEPVAELVPLHYEFEIAKEACAAQQLAQSIVWIPEDWETTVKSQHVFVRNLENDETMPANVTVYRVSFPELKNVIREACRTLGTKPSPQAMRRQIYLLYRPCDEGDPHLQALVHWVEALGREIDKMILRPLFVGDPAHLRAHDEGGRQASSTPLVYCGHNADSWAGGQYGVLKSSPHLPRRRVFYITSGTVNFFAPPERATSLDAGGQFDPVWADAHLRPLLTGDGI